MIRNFKESDIHDIETIYEKSNNALSLKTEPGFFSRDKKNFISKTVRNCRNLVYENEGKAVGIISCSHDYLEGLFVLPEYWNRGIGSELLKSVLSEKNELSLQVYSDNKRAVGFYRKHGFEIAGNGICPMTRLPYFEMRKIAKQREKL